MQPDVDNSPLRLGNFLVNARAQQTKERNRGRMQKNTIQQRLDDFYDE